MNKEEGKEKHNIEFLDLLKKIEKIKLEATERYGTKCWNSLGSKGLFVDINRKYWRIKHYIWESNKEMTSENIQDTLFDLAIYSLLTIMALERENEK